MISVVLTGLVIHVCLGKQLPKSLKVGSPILEPVPINTYPDNGSLAKQAQAARRPRFRSVVGWRTFVAKISSMLHYPLERAVAVAYPFQLCGSPSQRSREHN